MIYTYKCKCGESFDEFRRVEDRNNCPKCKCGKKTRRVISLPNIAPDLVPYWDENIGKEPVYIKSKQHRKQVAKDNGVAEY